MRDRIEPVATIPMFTPDEAVAELDHAVRELGAKAVMMTGTVPRPIAGTDGSPSGRWIDTIAHDSVYDYDPVWARCEELGVVPTFHGGGQGWGTRMSTTNMSYNQVGNFATAGEAICRSLVFGGVPKRFPQLRFAFQEGGVAWGASLLGAVLAHWEKRNIEAIQHYNPEHLDRALLEQLFRSARDRDRRRADRPARRGPAHALGSGRPRQGRLLRASRSSTVPTTSSRSSPNASSSAARPTTR